MKTFDEAVATVLSANEHRLSELPSTESHYSNADWRAMINAIAHKAMRPHLPGASPEAHICGSLALAFDMGVLVGMEMAKDK